MFQQLWNGSQWCDVIEFEPHIVLADIDREMGSWYAATHPQSGIRNRVMLGLALPNGRRVAILNEQFTLREGATVIESITVRSSDELLHLLHRYFHLSFPPGTTFNKAGYRGLASEGVKSML